MYANASASAASANSGHCFRPNIFIVHCCTIFLSALLLPVIYFLTWIGVSSRIFIFFFRNNVIRIALTPYTNSALVWLNFVKNNSSMHTVWILCLWISLVKKSSISSILANWSILVGDFLFCSKMPESMISRFLSINAYPSFLMPGSIPKIIFAW